MQATMYEFESKDFALSQTGIHLLRSGYNYDTIEFTEITRATIKRDGEIKNIIPSFIFGTLLVAFAILQALLVFRLVNDPTVYNIDIKTIILPVLPAIVGGYLLYIATKKGPVLVVEAGGKKYNLRLRDFIKDNKEKEMKGFLDNKLSYKLSAGN